MVHKYQKLVWFRLFVNPWSHLSTEYLTMLGYLMTYLSFYYKLDPNYFGISTKETNKEHISQKVLFFKFIDNIIRYALSNLS